MKDIDLLLAPILINKTINKLKISYDELKEKHPERIDLINSHDESIKDLVEVLKTFRFIDLENRSLGREVFNYSNKCLDLIATNRELTKTNKELDSVLNNIMNG